MEPISFLALYDEFCRVGKICRTRSVLSRLRDYVDHQVPGSRLTYLCQRASDRLLCFIRDSERTRQRGSRGSGQPGNVCPVYGSTTCRSSCGNNGLPCSESVWFGN